MHFHTNFVKLFKIAINPPNHSDKKKLSVCLVWFCYDESKGHLPPGSTYRLRVIPLSDAALCVKLPSESKLFDSMEGSVGGRFGVLPAHSAVVWATSCTTAEKHYATTLPLCTTEG